MERLYVFFFLRNKTQQNLLVLGHTCAYFQHHSTVKKYVTRFSRFFLSKTRLSIKCEFKYRNLFNKKTKTQNEILESNRLWKNNYAGKLIFKKIYFVNLRKLFENINKILYKHFITQKRCNEL